MGTSRAGPAKHSRGPAQAGDEGNSEPADQASRNIPSVRAFDPGRGNGRFFREDAPVAIHDLCLQRSTGKTWGNSGTHARGRHGALADRKPDGQSAILEINSRIRRSDWCARGLKYVL